jgi:predicted nucleic-acid-binding protein
VIALDTNVLVRFLVEDDRDQCERARRLVASVSEAEQTCFVSDVVMCETVWVLASCYRFSREKISTVLRAVLRARQLAFQSSERIAKALAAYEEGRGDFADFMIRDVAEEAGCDSVATFDRELVDQSGFVEP